MPLLSLHTVKASVSKEMTSQKLLLGMVCLHPDETYLLFTLSQGRKPEQARKSVSLNLESLGSNMCI